MAAGVVALLMLIIFVPLLVLPGFRLSLAQRAGWVAGSGAAKLYEGSDPVELVVLTESVPILNSLPLHRYRARYVAERSDDEVLLHDLDDRAKSLRVPMSRYDLISGSTDGSRLLFVNQATGGAPEALLVVTASGTVDRLPPGEMTPASPGDWQTDLAMLARIDCGGVSPRGTWTACLRHGDSSSPYLFGEWELQIAPFGRARAERAIYRGRGADPIVGWATDEMAIYFQNETGLWRVPVPPVDQTAS